MSEMKRSIHRNVSKKWEEFVPQKLEGVEEYTYTDISKVFGVHWVTVQKCLAGNATNYNPVLVRKIQAFASDVGYDPKCAMQIGAKRAAHSAVNTHIKKRHFDSVQQRNEHMYMLREQGYTNAQIAKFTGYTSEMVRNIIGTQPIEYTQASHKRRGELYHRECEDRKALAAARQKKVDAANAQVESYNAAVDELARLDEAVAMAKMKYIQQKSTVEKMRGALSSCAEYATIPIKPIPDAEQNGENRPN